MSEVTIDTFKEAAFAAGRRLRGEEDSEAEDAKQTLKERIQKILESGEIMQEGSTRDISTKVAESLLSMLWPEKGLEIKKKRAEMEVDRAALLGYIRDVMNGKV